MVFFSAIFLIPTAREIVTTTGKTSGIAATAIDIAVMILVSKDNPLLIPIAIARKPERIAISPRTFPSFCIFTCRGAMVVSSLLNKLDILPISVFIPVFSTRTFAFPVTTNEPEKTKSFLSPKESSLEEI